MKDFGRKDKDKVHEKEMLKKLKYSKDIIFAMKEAAGERESNGIEQIFEEKPTSIKKTTEEAKTKNAKKESTLPYSGPPVEEPKPLTNPYLDKIGLEQDSPLDKPEPTPQAKSIKNYSDPSNSMREFKAQKPRASFEMESPGMPINEAEVKEQEQLQPSANRSEIVMDATVPSQKDEGTPMDGGEDPPQDQDVPVCEASEKLDD